jgi:hypothetical protein
MLRTASGRAVAVAVLLAGLVLLCPLYAAQPVNPEAGVYLTGNEFTQSPAQYLGDAVVTQGSVQQTSPLVIKGETTHGTAEVTVIDSDLRPESGDKVRVFGTIPGPDTIQTVNGFVVPQSGLWYTWVVSFLAGLWVLGRLIRHWTVDVSRLRIRRRDSPLSLRTRLTAWRSHRGDQRA